ncbi:hypothetical protein BKA70DRAFT_1239272 [Coprinopsis sp. MPI-PUGE-AT-0042]|nr:hypothetical protein BKA70DRAFT_1239272 [Coprinopsis sp. MPI-PUGE-AT-0042]
MPRGVSEFALHASQQDKLQASEVGDRELFRCQKLWVRCFSWEEWRTTNAGMGGLLPTTTSIRRGSSPSKALCYAYPRVFGTQRHFINAFISLSSKRQTFSTSRHQVDRKRGAKRLEYAKYPTIYTLSHSNLHVNASLATYHGGINATVADQADLSCKAGGFHFRQLVELLLRQYPDFFTDPDTVLGQTTAAISSQALWRNTDLDIRYIISFVLGYLMRKVAGTADTKYPFTAIRQFRIFTVASTDPDKGYGLLNIFNHILTKCSRFAFLVRSEKGVRFW